MPTWTERVADLPISLPAKLRVLRGLARTGVAQGRLRAWAAEHPDVVTGSDWYRRAWWGLVAGEVVREHLFDPRRRAAALSLVDEGPWSVDIDAERCRGGVVLVTAHVGPPKLLMNVLLDRFPQLLVWTNTEDMPAWLPAATTATLLDPRVPRDRSALLVRSALHLKAGGIVLGAADYPTGDRVATQPGLGLEAGVSLGLPSLCRRLGVPAFFIVALWHGDRIRIASARLEAPEGDLTDDEWNQRWVQAYAAHLGRAAGCGPENLRVLRAVAGGALARAVGVGGRRASRTRRPS